MRKTLNFIQTNLADLKRQTSFRKRFTNICVSSKRQGELHFQKFRNYYLNVKSSFDVTFLRFRIFHEICHSSRY